MNNQRDLTIVNLVSKFHQISSSQIHSLVFDNSPSHTPTNRTLRRLVADKFLARIERRIVGGAHGGSGVYVYVLGLEGHELSHSGLYRPGRVVSYHSLAIVDCFIILTKLARQGRLEVSEYSTEPDTYETVRTGKGEITLKPDFYVELVRQNPKRVIRFMFEVDMGTQGQRQITDKFERYWRASAASWRDNQFVLFIAVDDARVNELSRLLAKWAHASKDDSQERSNLFRIMTAERFAAVMASD